MPAARVASWQLHLCAGYTAAVMQRSLIALGILILLAGLLWPWLGKLPFGRLPGDIFVDRPGFKLYFPLGTMLIISVLISVLFWLFRR
ncbi:hypothetical protein BH24PSE2_BH24PSE2_15860 [soil metagenome]